MEINHTSGNNFLDYVMGQRTDKHPVSSQEGFNFGEYLHSKLPNCPYSALAKDGIIQYNGVTFVCDSDTNSICLGDMSDPKKILNITLSGGGHLKVNVDNIGDISKATGMFSAEDMGAILRAISEYEHCTSKIEEIKEEENEAVEEATEAAEIATFSVNEAMEYLKSYSQDMYEKIMHNETEQTFRIGGEEMTLKEWDTLLSNYDEIQDELKEEVEAMKERNEEDLESEE